VLHRGRCFHPYARQTHLVPAGARLVAPILQHTGDTDSTHRVHVTVSLWTPLPKTVLAKIPAEKRLKRIVAPRNGGETTNPDKVTLVDKLQKDFLLDKLRLGNAGVRWHSRCQLLLRLHTLVSEPAKIIKPGINQTT
jgi:hypothetical protein